MTKTRMSTICVCYLAFGILLFTGINAMSNTPLMVASALDLDRFMGRWYVIATIPTPFERGAHNATEDYELQPNGRVATTFTYNKGSLDGPVKVARPTGFVSEDNPAIWKMQFLWPFKADYRVMYVDEAHSLTIVGREKRDYVWLMARTPEISPEAYERSMAMIQDQGYDLSKVVRIAHSGDS